MFGKILVLFLAVLAYVTMAATSCRDVHPTAHCEIFKPFCGEAQYKTVRSGCAKTCGDC